MVSRICFRRMDEKAKGQALTWPRKDEQMTNIERKSKVTAYLSTESIQSKLKSFFNNDQNKIQRFKSTMELRCAENDFIKYDPISVLLCGIKSAEIGLSPMKEFGHVYFVPYGNKLEIQIGYKGWRTLLERAGKIVKEHRVYKCDDFNMVIEDFEERYVLSPKFEEHKESNPQWVIDNLKGVLVSIKDLHTKITYNKFVTADKIFQIQGASPSKKSGPWHNWKAEMVSAKAIKYVVSKIPVDEKIAIAINYDNELDTKMIDDGRRESVYEQILNHPEEDQSLPEEHQVENENQDEVQNDIPL